MEYTSEDWLYHPRGDWTGEAIVDPFCNNNVPLQIGSVLTVVLTARLGLTAVARIQELNNQDDAAEEGEVSIVSLILMGCVGFLIIGLVGIISNSLLLHGTRKVVFMRKYSKCCSFELIL